jgi:protein phosphatase
MKNANMRVYFKSMRDAKYYGMGTTMTMALLGKDRLYIGHVGDCRAYLLKNDAIELLTHDHTLLPKWLKTVLSAPIWR